MDINDILRVPPPLLPLEALPKAGRAPLDPVAGRAAWDEFEAVWHQVPLIDAVMLACLAYQRSRDARGLR